MKEHKRLLSAKRDGPTLSKSLRTLSFGTRIWAQLCIPLWIQKSCSSLQPFTTSSTFLYEISQREKSLCLTLPWCPLKETTAGTKWDTCLQMSFWTAFTAKRAWNTVQKAAKCWGVEMAVVKVPQTFNEQLYLVPKTTSSEPTLCLQCPSYDLWEKWTFPLQRPFLLR